jgi:hypothetical protein
MKSRILATCCFFALVTALVPNAGADAKKDAGWKAGVARVRITPERFMMMSGYAGRGPADGMLTDLWAKALVLEGPDGRRAVLVTLDLVGIDRGVSLAIRGELKKKYGFDLPAVILATSHTHTGPMVGDNLRTMFLLKPEQEKQIDDYTRTLHDKVVAVVGDAVKRLAPAQLSWEVGESTFAVNRRNNKEAAVPKLREAGEQAPSITNCRCWPCAARTTSCAPWSSATPATRPC